MTSNSSISSNVIFTNQHYTACAMSDGSMIVTSNRIQKGTRLIGAAAVEWKLAIETAIDAYEASALCKALVNR